MSQIGRHPLRVEDFGQFVEEVQLYLAKRRVEHENFTATMAELFEIDASIERAGKPPLDISATGPKTISIAARLADSVTFSVGANVRRLRECITYARDARRAAGLDPDSLLIGCHVAAAVVADGVDHETARNIVKPGVLRHAHFSAFGGKLLDGVHDTDREALLGSYRSFRDPTFKGFKRTNVTNADDLPDDFVDRFAIIGEPSECADRFEELIELGIDRMLVMTRVPGTDKNEENTSRIAQLVLSRLR
jgi:alkanesulfonate monooxygenase SsuD/methylene tetrahydromethanopterin reductase-like flavin-dependent oxidoreductase (luciferase family)